MNGLSTGRRGINAPLESYLDLGFDFPGPPAPRSSYSEFFLSSPPGQSLPAVQAVYVEYELYRYETDRSSPDYESYLLSRVGDFVPFAFWYGDGGGATSRTIHHYIMGYDPMVLAEWENVSYAVPVFYYYQSGEWHSIKSDCASRGSLPYFDPVFSNPSDPNSYETLRVRGSVSESCPIPEAPSARCTLSEFYLTSHFYNGKKWSETRAFLRGLRDRATVLDFQVETYGRLPGTPDRTGRTPLPGDTLQFDLCRRDFSGDLSCAAGDELGQIRYSASGTSTSVAVRAPVLLSQASYSTQNNWYSFDYDPGSVAEQENIELVIRTAVNGDWLHASEATVYVPAALAAEEPLLVTADPDTLSAGGEAHFTIAAPGLDPATPVTFSVPDLTLGGFAADVPVARGTARRDASVERVLSVTRPLSEVSEIRFIAADDVDSTATVTITATAGGRSGTVDVTIMPLRLRLLRQNGAEVKAGYVMVSKVRPDWYLPTEDLLFETRTGYRIAFPDDDRPLSEPPIFGYDPHTYRLQAAGIQQLTEPANLVFRLSVSRAGQPVPIWANGVTGVDRVTGVDGEDFVSLPAVCEGVAGFSVQTCRSTKFIRLVSNSRPYELRGITPNCGRYTDPAGCYDDEVAGTQTIRVELGDYVRWELYSDSRLGSDSLRVGAPDVEPVGEPDDEGNGYDIARTVQVRFVGTQGLEAPMDANATARRMSEYWAQAAINFQSQGNGLTVPDLGSTDPSSTARPNTYEIDTEAGDAAGIEPTVPADGLLWATVGGGSRISTPVSRGELVHDAVVRLVGRLNAPAGTVQVVRHRMRDYGTEGDPYDYSTLVHLRPGFGPGLTIGSDVPGLRIQPRKVIGGDMATEVPLVESPYKRLALELHVLALTYGSEDAHTVDAYVVPDSALARVRVGPDGTGMLGQAFTADFLGGEAPALVNSFVMVSNAADGHDAAQGSQAYGLPATASHEVGHVLFNSEYPGPGESTLTHSPSTLNVMYFQGGDISDPVGNPVISEPALVSRRRLSARQQTDVRLSRPSLLSPFVPVTPFTPVAPRAAAAEPTAIRTVFVPPPAPVIVTREHE